MRDEETEEIYLDLDYVKKWAEKLSFLNMVFEIIESLSCFCGGIGRKNYWSMV